ncbi:hypothetical protein B0F90DRAFT_1752875 [Multifurca ochricompacta]|uniref:Uncharacterized protein n=1 Tax=Multifurca ochricompacta TaxID=376703 RepID=A0AAD4QKY1_9AGAM|nr:hypothetical protein B0F90DRAFT_1752875 [Multifurca ochricompacta]
MEVTTLDIRTSPGGATAKTTTDSRMQTRNSQSPSFIPLLSPKAARNQPLTLNSSLPSSLSVPQLGLVPPNRTPSGGSSPSHHATIPSLPQAPSTQASSSTSSSSSSSALPSLRSLRSFLPFGSGKSTTASAASGPLKGPFASFAPVRRSSATIERKNSGQFPRSGDKNDVAVISIAPSPHTSSERSHDTSNSADAHILPLPSLSVSPLHGEELGPPVVTFNPDPPLRLSKHLPTLEESRSSEISGNRPSANHHGTFPPSPEINNYKMIAPDTSLLDLSTSHLKEEKPSRNGWLTGVVVEDATDSNRPASRNDRAGDRDGYVQPEESFHLDSLDPDLAALLSPNRMGVKLPMMMIHSEDLSAPTLAPQNPRLTAPPRIFLPSRAVTPQSRPSPLGSSSATGSARSQSSPVRATTSQADLNMVRSVPSSSRFVPRLMRSATDRIAPVRGNHSVENITRVPSDSALLPLNEARRVSSDSIYLRRPPASPLPIEFQPQSQPQSQLQPQLQPPLQHPNNTESQRRVPTSRVVTPARFSRTQTPATSRLLLRSAALPSSSAAAAATGIPRSWGAESPSPTSRTSSALGSAVDHLNRPRTSVDGALEGRPSARERLGYPIRNRNRSLSVGGGNGDRVASPGPRSTDWLGPRTVKAFAAAGLLDRDLGNNGSRFGSVRSLGDRDQQHQRALAPSRLALSEAGSVASSWRSGSVSRTMTHSSEAAAAAAAGLDGASTSTGGAPRTTRSAESTAPTSISLSCPQSRTPSPQQHKHYQMALQTMQEKHATETGTLLAALADAQHNAQSLRADNAKLLERIEDLEAQLVSAHAQLRSHQYISAAATAATPSSPRSQPLLSRAVFNRIERQGSADALGRRKPPLPIPILGQGQGQGFKHLLDSRYLEDGADAEDGTVGRVAISRRASGGAESVFAIPPPNMSMLLQEQPAGSRHSVSSSVSMTTVSAPTDGPGSPRSLFLRPEHDLHLGDLGSSFDMHSTEDEVDDDDDDDDDDEAF